MEHPQSTARPRLLSETMTPASEVTRTPGERPGGYPATEEAQEDEEGAEEAMEGEGNLEPYRSGPGDLESLLKDGDHSRYNHFSSTFSSHQTQTVIL